MQAPKIDLDKLDVAVLGGAQINLDIPADATLTQVEETLQIVVTGYGQLVAAAERLKPIIGRILVVVDTRRLWVTTHTGFTEYLNSLSARFGLARQTAFEALRIARKFPDLTQAEYAKYGASRLLLAAGITDSTDPEHRNILDQLSKMTVQEGRDKLKAARNKLKQGALLNGEAPPEVVTVTIKTIASVRDRWQQALAATDLGASELFSQMVETWFASEVEETEPAPAHAA
jgi:hypothetical protein